MAFPGELNINYYRGDTYEFNIYPKKTDGTGFDLTGFLQETFKIATVRGSDGLATQINGSARISDDKSYIACAITPDAGAEMTPGTTYVYDIQAYLPGGSSYDKVITFLTGSISVTDDVTQGLGDS